MREQSYNPFLVQRFGAKQAERNVLFFCSKQLKPEEISFKITLKSIEIELKVKKFSLLFNLLYKFQYT